MYIEIDGGKGYTYMFDDTQDTPRATSAEPEEAISFKDISWRRLLVQLGRNNQIV
jgi:hypothetical protein